MLFKFIRGKSGRSLFAVGLGLTAFVHFAYAQTGTLSANFEQRNCNNGRADQALDCQSFTLTATGGELTLGAFPGDTWGNEGEYRWTYRAATTCAEGMTLVDGQSCVVAPALRTLQAGPITAPLSIPAIDSNTVTVNFTTTRTGVVMTPQSIDLGAIEIGDSRTFTVDLALHGRSTAYVSFTSLQSGLEHVSGCSGSIGTSCTATFRWTALIEGPRASAIQPFLFTNAAKTSVFGYGLGRVDHFGGSAPPQWQAGEYGACAGGAGEWFVGDWLPAVACGEVEQSRSATCSVITGSGTRARDVQCVSGAGDILEDSACADAGEKPAEEEGCTPIGTSACGTSPSTHQFVTLNNGCTTGCTPDPTTNRYCLYMPF